MTNCHINHAFESGIAGVAAPKHYPRKLTLECFGANLKTLKTLPQKYSRVF